MGVNVSPVVPMVLIEATIICAVDDGIVLDEVVVSFVVEVVVIFCINADIVVTTDGDIAMEVVLCFKVGVTLFSVVTSRFVVAEVLSSVVVKGLVVEVTKIPIVDEVVLVKVFIIFPASDGVVVTEFVFPFIVTIGCEVVEVAVTFCTNADVSFIVVVGVVVTEVAVLSVGLFDLTRTELQFILTYLKILVIFVDHDIQHFHHPRIENSYIYLCKP